MPPADWLKAYVRDVPDFPQPGVVFKDITPLLSDVVAFSSVIDLIVVAFGHAASAQEVRERLPGEDVVTLSVVPTAGDDAQRATAEALLSGVLQRALPDGLRPFTGVP